MNNVQRGAILIVVVGVLAVFFILGITAIIISSLSEKQVQNDKDAFIARLCADSAYEYSLGIVANLQKSNSTYPSTLSEVVGTLDSTSIKDYIISIMGKRSSDCKLVNVRDNAGKCIFDISSNNDMPYQFSGITIPGEHRFHAFAYLDYTNDDIDDPGVIDPNIPPDTPVEICRGTWRINLYGWGFTSLLPDSDSILPAGASMFSKAQIELEYHVTAVFHQDDNNFTITVWLPNYKLVLRKFSDNFDEFKMIPWPFKEN